MTKPLWVSGFWISVSWIPRMNFKDDGRLKFRKEFYCKSLRERKQLERSKTRLLPRHPLGANEAVWGWRMGRGWDGQCSFPSHEVFRALSILVPGQTFGHFLMHTSQAGVVLKVVMQKEKDKRKKWAEESESWSISDISGLWAVGQRCRSGPGHFLLSRDRGQIVCLGGPTSKLPNSFFLLPSSLVTFKAIKTH